MDDDSLIDDVLKAALATAAPEPSPGFHAAVRRRLASRSVSSWRVWVLAAYTVASAIACVWLLRDLPLVLVGACLAGGAGAALSTGLYASRLAGLRD